MALGATTQPTIAASPAIHITLDLPIPPSVNRTRRVDWAGDKKRRQFYLHADFFVVAHGPRPPPVRLVTGAYQLLIQIPDGSRGDLDNFCKALIDYLVSREFVAGDDPHNLRRLVVEWIDPEICPFCRVTIAGVAS